MDFFSSHLNENKYTSVKDYLHFRHTLQYINQRMHAYWCHEDGKNHKEKLIVLAQILGYAEHSIPKLKIRIDLWLNLSGEIPIKFFEAIGVQEEVLAFALALDQEEFEYALKIPVFPLNFVARLMPTVYMPMRLPEGTSEQEAIAIVQAYQLEHDFKCWINIGEIKTIYFEPKSHVGVILHPPVLAKVGKIFTTKNRMNPGNVQIR